MFNHAFSWNLSLLRHSCIENFDTNKENTTDNVIYEARLRSTDIIVLMEKQNSATLLIRGFDNFTNV